MHEELSTNKTREDNYGFGNTDIEVSSMSMFTTYLVLLGIIIDMFSWGEGVLCWCHTWSYINGILYNAKRKCIYKFVV